MKKIHENVYRPFQQIFVDTVDKYLLSGTMLNFTQKLYKHRDPYKNI